MSKTVRRFALVAMVVAAGGFAGWLGWQARKASALPVGIVSGNGRIESVQVDVTAKYPGRLAQILVREGDLVKPGQVVARIDTDETEAMLSKSKAQVAQAKASVAEVRAEIAKDESNARLAEQNYARGRTLFQRKSISRQEYDELVSKRDSANAAVESSKAKLNVALSQIESTLSEVHRYEVQIADSTLKSPVHGRVLYRLAEEGEVLASGGKALTLINLGDVYMEIYLPSREAARVEIGADARIVLDAAPAYSARARVDFVSPETQFTPKQVETASERDKLMFRVKLRVPEELILKHIEKVKTGIRGVGYIKLDPSIPWPERLDRRFPDRIEGLGNGKTAADPAPPIEPGKPESTKEAGPEPLKKEEPKDAPEAAKPAAKPAETPASSEPRR